MPAPPRRTPPSSPACPRPSSTSTTSAPPRRGSSPSSPPGTPARCPRDPDALRDFYTFRDFGHFIEVYLAVVDLLREPEDIRLLTYEVAAEMAAQNIRYAELTLHAVHLGAGRRPDRGLRRGHRGRPGRRRARPRRAAALDLRHPGRVRPARGRRHAGATRSTTRPEALIGFGLGGPEVGVDRPQFKDVLRRRPAPPGCTASRTPARPPARRPSGTRSAMLGAERIGHGTSSVQDPELLAHLAEHRIPLEVCPTSNIATRAVDVLENHPIRQMYDAGRARHGQQRRPADVRHHAQPRVRDRRRPARPRRAGHRAARQERRARVVPARTPRKPRWPPRSTSSRLDGCDEMAHLGLDGLLEPTLKFRSEAVDTWGSGQAHHLTGRSITSESAAASPGAWGSPSDPGGIGRRDRGVLVHDARAGRPRQDSNLRPPD